MNASSFPWQVLSSSIALGVLTEGWTLATVADSDDTETVRSFRLSVAFAASFQAPPVVQISLTGFDVDNRDSGRLRITAENITTTGFDVVVGTWSSTRVYGVDVQWLAVGA